MQLVSAMNILWNSNSSSTERFNKVRKQNSSLSSLLFRLFSDGMELLHTCKWCMMILVRRSYFRLKLGQFLTIIFVTWQPWHSTVNLYRLFRKIDPKNEHINALLGTRQVNSMKKSIIKIVPFTRLSYLRVFWAQSLNTSKNDNLQNIVVDLWLKCTQHSKHRPTTLTCLNYSLLFAVHCCPE